MDGRGEARPAPAAACDPPEAVTGVRKSGARCTVRQGQKRAWGPDDNAKTEEDDAETKTPGRLTGMPSPLTGVGFGNWEKDALIFPSTVGRRRAGPASGLSQAKQTSGNSVSLGQHGKETNSRVEGTCLLPSVAPACFPL